MEYLNMYWDGVLNVPLGWVVQYLGVDMSGWKEVAFKIACTIGILVFFYEIYLRVKEYRRRSSYNRELKAYGKLGGSGLSGEEHKAVRENPEGIIARLKKEGSHEKLGEVYGTLGRHKEAAKAWKRGGHKKEAAAEWVKAGYPLKAARLLYSAGEYEAAGKLYMEKKSYRSAAKSFKLAKSFARAADSFHLAGRYADSLAAFETYFATPGSEDAAAQMAGADACAQFLQDPKVQAALPNEKLRMLCVHCGRRMQSVKRPEVAAKLFQQAGELVMAGEAYLIAGQLEAAARCMNQAGETKRASEIGGRYYESLGKWKEAGMAYEGGGDFRKAGDCFAKVNEPLRAANNYERAQEFYRAGLAMVHAKNWEDAVRLLQKLPENHPNFSESRALLGRAFYELKAFAQSAATLENHLMGERVRKDNIDYFWMLALAYEQLGKLKESEETLLKIRSVDLSFRDVSQRLSNVQSRISMHGGDLRRDVSSMPTMATPAPPQDGKSPVMSMVEKGLHNRYDLERELGRGGMGVVYKARDTQLDRPVALKFLGSLVDGSEEFRQRFQREARAAAQVSHQNILSIYDIGVEQGNTYIAMEYVEGPNLNQYLGQKGKLPVREAVNLIGQACSALEAIHQAGIVHRDIKPDNILIAKGGLVKLMDFGLAKGYGQRLTGSHVIMGTPCYMSPEQARGGDVGPKSDIYAIGLVLYELLTGKTVFSDGNVLERQILEMPPRPSEVVEGVPELLDNIIMKAIAKDPAERFDSAGQLLQYLRMVDKQ
jgi:tetratricopeptide (TPR) repeat protein/predicted Ser/Thr protein kinase